MPMVQKLEESGDQRAFISGWTYFLNLFVKAIEASQLSILRHLQQSIPFLQNIPKEL